MSKITDIVEDLRNIENLTGSAQEVLVSGENIKTINGQYQKIVSTKQAIVLQSKKDLTIYQEIVDNQEFARNEIGRLEQLIYIDDK